MHLGSRIFSPRPVTTLLTLVLLVLLVALGRWQLRRAAEKQALFDAFDKGDTATQPIAAGTAELPRYQHVEAEGAYDDAQQVLIDNMTDSSGRAGYFVITPFALTGGGWVLVNRGWVPLGSSRAVLPGVEVSPRARRLRGRTDHLPAPGIQLGQAAALHPPFPVVAAFPAHADIARLVNVGPWTRAAEVVLLDADQPDGYVRQWHAPGLPPLRHIAYAVQWFGLAAALCVLYVVTNLRAPERRTAAA